MRSAKTDDDLSRAQYADMKTYLPGDILTKVDRTSMAVSLEVRAPIIDHEFMEWAAGIPAAMRLKGRRRQVHLQEGAGALSAARHHVSREDGLRGADLGMVPRTAAPAGRRCASRATFWPIPACSIWLSQEARRPAPVRRVRAFARAVGAADVRILAPESLRKQPDDTEARAATARRNASKSGPEGSGAAFRSGDEGRDATSCIRAPCPCRSRGRRRRSRRVPSSEWLHACACSSASGVAALCVGARIRVGTLISAEQRRDIGRGDQRAVVHEAFDRDVADLIERPFALGGSHVAHGAAELG